MNHNLDLKAGYTPRESLRKSGAETVLPFMSWLRRRISRIEHDSNHLMHLHAKWQRVIDFISGQQLGQREKGISGYGSYSRRPEDMKFVDNILHPLYTRLLRLFSSSNPRVKWEGGSNPTLRRVATAANLLTTFCMHKHFTELLAQQEAGYLLTTGNCMYYAYINPEGGVDIEVPRYATESVALDPGGLVCSSCGARMQVDPLMIEDGAYPEMCPDCGGIMRPDPLMAEMPYQAGTDKYKSGEPVIEVLPPTEFDMPVTFGDNSYLCRRRLFSVDLIKKHFPWVEYNYSDSSFHYSGSVSTYLERLLGNVGNFEEQLSDVFNSRWGNSRHKEMVSFFQVWLRPVVYGDYIFPDDLELVDRVIPKNTRLSEVFPRGLVASFCGNTLIDLNEQDPDDHFVHGRYNPMPYRKWADGAFDNAIDPQVKYNILNSLSILGLAVSACPPVIYDPAKTDGPISGNPVMAIAIKNRLPGEPLDAAVSRMPGGNINPLLINYMGQLQQRTQDITGAVIGLGGGSNSAANTATGATLLGQEQALAVTPQLQLRAECRKQLYGLVSALIQRHLKSGGEEFYLKALGGRVTPSSLQALKDADLRNEMTLVLSSSSVIPLTTEERQNQLNNLMQYGGLPGGPLNPNFPSSLRREILELFNLDAESDQYELNRQREQELIEKMIAYLPVAEEQSMFFMAAIQAQMDETQALEEQFTSDSPGDIGPSDEGLAMSLVDVINEEMSRADPANLLNVAFPLEPNVDIPQARIEAIREWLLSDAGQEYPPNSTLRKALIQRIELLKQSIIQQQQQEMMSALQAQAMQQAAMSPPVNSNESSRKETNAKPG